MSGFPSRSFRENTAIVLAACCFTGFGLRAVQVNLSKVMTDQELAIFAIARSVVDMTVEELLRIFPEDCRDLEFDASQAELGLLLQKTGSRVEALFRDIPNTTSNEQVRRERLGFSGSGGDSSTQSYNYLVLSDKSGTWEEVRTDRRGRPAQYDGMNFFMTSGFAGLVMFLHPQHRDDCRFRLLGRQKSEPRAYVIAFSQKVESGRPTGKFKGPGMFGLALMMYQGLAWIDPQSHQIVRMRTDLLAPRMDVLLARLTTETWFREVRFSTSPQAFWLPREVVVTIEWKGQVFKNRHLYSEYRVFSVVSDDKLQQPIIKK
jgi:hypothetical protein